MARSIGSKWNKVVDLSLKEAGVRTPSGAARRR